MTTTVIDNPTEQRYEILVDGARAGLAEYRRTAGAIHFTHTEVDEAYSGRGLARVLVEHALSAARDAGDAVLPHCPYVRKVIHDAPERWLDLVPADRRTEFDLPA